MASTQLDNLIQFCFVFHPSCGYDWTMQSPDYLKEKWNKYIGIDVKHHDLEKSYFTHNTINWLKRWNVSNEDWIELKRVIRFIISLSEKPLFKTGRYKEVWTLSEIVENFENQIAPISEIIQTPYNHTHDLIKLEIEKWLDGVQNKREYQLCALIN
jgi:hypothetical protein